MLSSVLFFMINKNKGRELWCYFKKCGIRVRKRNPYVCLLKSLFLFTSVPSGKKTDVVQSFYLNLFCDFQENKTFRLDSLGKNGSLKKILHLLTQQTLFCSRLWCECCRDSEMNLNIQGVHVQDRQEIGKGMERDEKEERLHMPPCDVDLTFSVQLTLSLHMLSQFCTTCSLALQPDGARLEWTATKRSHAL